MFRFFPIFHNQIRTFLAQCFFFSEKLPLFAKPLNFVWMLYNIFKKGTSSWPLSKSVANCNLPYWQVQICLCFGSVVSYHQLTLIEGRFPRHCVLKHHGTFNEHATKIARLSQKQIQPLKINEHHCSINLASLLFFQTLTAVPPMVRQNGCHFLLQTFPFLPDKKSFRLLISIEFFDRQIWFPTLEYHHHHRDGSSFFSINKSLGKKLFHHVIPWQDSLTVLSNRSQRIDPPPANIICSYGNYKCKAITLNVLHIFYLIARITYWWNNLLSICKLLYCKLSCFHIYHNCVM